MLETLPQRASRIPWGVLMQSVCPSVAITPWARHLQVAKAGECGVSARKAASPVEMPRIAAFCSDRSGTATDH